MISKNDRIVVGKFDKRISLHQNVISSDGAGGQTYALVEIASVWGSIDPVSASQAMHMDRSVQDTTHIIKIRYGTFIDFGQGYGSKPSTNYEIRYKSRRFKVNTVIDMGERSRIYEIMATEENLDTTA